MQLNLSYILHLHLHIYIYVVIDFEKFTYLGAVTSYVGSYLGSFNPRIQCSLVPKAHLLNNAVIASECNGP